MRDTTPAASRPLFVDAPDTWKKQQISVCWRIQDAARPEVHEWVREAVVNSWDFVSGLEFIGWAPCSKSGADIEISVRDTLWPAVTGGLGKDIAEMRLNFDPNAGYCGFGHPDETYRSCMEFIAIHEFGHAIGYAHEQNRDDTPGTCTSPAQGSNGTDKVGPWDGDSIMNYCNAAYAAHPWLSGTDIEGTQRFYGISDEYHSAILAVL